MLQHLISQRLNLRKCQIGARLRIIGERANGSGTNGYVEFPTLARGLGSAGGIDAVTEVGADSDGFRGGSANYVLALRVCCVEGLGGGVDGVTEDLNDGFGTFAFEPGEGPEAGAAAVESDGGDGDVETGEGKERNEGCGEVHSTVMKRGPS